MVQPYPRRIGARRTSDVTPEVRHDLEHGSISTATHVEHMAIDQAPPWIAVFPDLPQPADRFADKGFISKLREGGRLLYESLGAAAWDMGSADPDTVLAWRAFAITAAANHLDEQLSAIVPFAEHPHFAVREWAWLAVRPAIAAHPVDAIIQLTAHTKTASAYWRRFTCEATRPRSVWGVHIPELKRRPEAAESLLGPRLTDDSPYVLASATNWLNDVSRTHLAWVTMMCRTYGGPQSTRLLARATRSARPPPASSSRS